MSGLPPELSVVVPVYNEAESLAPLLAELGAVLDRLGRRAEIVAVDDGSTDGSFARLVALAATEPRLRVVRLARNYGQTAALAAGIEHARGAILVSMDADLQNDPADVPRLLEALRDDVDVVNGWRHPRRDPWLTRRVPSRIANRIISLVTGTRLHDYGCTLRAMRAPLAKELGLYGEMHRFIPALAADLGARVVEVRVRHRPRMLGRSKYGLSRTLRVVLDLLTVKFLSGFSTRPIQAFGVIGVLCAVVGLALTAQLGFERIVLGVRLGGRPIVLLAILLVVVGVQFVSLGLLGEMVVRTYHESQRKPIYRVREVVGVVLLLILFGIATPARALDGAEIYADACAACHGTDGRGATGSGVAVPLPDFTDCTVSTAETTANWTGLVRRGGPFLGMSPQMPAFGGVLSDDEIRAVLAYVRGFCGDPRYPVGDLNFRRPVFVEKAFPENEAIASGDGARARRERTGAAELALERRIGPRGQVEVAVPAGVVDPDGGPARAGIGDLALSYRHVLLAVPRWWSIVSAGTELVLPTGNRRNGVGEGTTVVAPQLLSGHRLGPVVVQTQVRAELPADTARAARQMLYRLALQLPLGPYKKSLVPAVEFEQSQALDAAVHAATLLGPSLYVPLSRRGHVAVGVGAQFPVAGTRPFDWELAGFFLWEYRDGPLWAW